MRLKLLLSLFTILLTVLSDRLSRGLIEFDDLQKQAVLTKFMTTV